MFGQRKNTSVIKKGKNIWGQNTSTRTYKDSTGRKHVTKRTYSKNWLGQTVITEKKVK